MDKAELEWMRELKAKLEKQIKGENRKVSTINKAGLKLRPDESNAHHD
jgi:hypothetical protein